MSPERHRVLDRTAPTGPVRLDLLRASAQSRLPLALESLRDLAHRAGVPVAVAREEARHLVSAGHWVRTGRHADTRYAVTPAGREYLSARRRETHLSGLLRPRPSHRQVR